MTHDLIPIVLPLVWVAMGIPGYFMIRSDTREWSTVPALWTASVCIIFGPVPTIIESIWFCIKRFQ
jgi:hypothetical protein